MIDYKLHMPTNFVDYAGEGRSWVHASILFQENPFVILKKRFLIYNALQVCVSRGAPLELIEKVATFHNSTLLNDTDFHGRTALHFACTNFRISADDKPYENWNSRKEIIRLLLYTCNAKANIKNNHGMTCLNFLLESKCEDEEIYELLLNKMNISFFEYQNYAKKFNMEVFFTKVYNKIMTKKLQLILQCQLIMYLH